MRTANDEALAILKQFERDGIAYQGEDGRWRLREGVKVLDRSPDHYVVQVPRPN
jgi:hypothetical protein